MSNTSKLSITDIPKLSYDPTSYARWRSEVEILLQLSDCWNAALGQDAEPYRARTILSASEAASTISDLPRVGETRRATRSFAATAAARDSSQGSPLTSVPEDTTLPDSVITQLNGLDVGQRLTRAGSVPPSQYETDSPHRPMNGEERREWERWQTRENKAQAILKGTVSPSIKLDIEDMLSSSVMWSHCLVIHNVSIEENRRDIQRRLYSYDLREDATSEEMAKHVESFSRTVMEAKVIGMVLTDVERASIFANSILAPSFRPIIMEINAVPANLRTWSYVLLKFNAESARRNVRPVARSARNSKGYALVAGEEKNYQDGNKREGYLPRGRGGHRGRGRRGAGSGRTGMDRAGTNRPPRDMSTVQCYNCDGYGHISRNCDKPRRKHTDEKPSDGKTHRPEARSAMLSTADLETNHWDDLSAMMTTLEGKAQWCDLEDDDGPMVFEDHLEANPWEDTSAVQTINREAMFIGEDLMTTWVIDSGATHHLTPYRHILNNIRPLDEVMTFGTADRVVRLETKEVGDVHVRLENGNRVVVRDVFHVPKSRVSLLSLSRLLKMGWKANLEDRGGTISKDEVGQVTLTKKGPLWITHIGDITHNAFTTSLSRRSPLAKEHERLGHMGKERLMELAKAGKLKEGYETYRNDPFKTANCITCQVAKFSRPPKNDLAPLLMGNGAGVGLDVDLAGPYNESRDGYTYLFVGIERWSQIALAVPLESKAEAADVIMQTVYKLEKQLGERVRVIRSDGGGEFENERLQEFCEIAGIQRYVSPRYTPELNGAAERMVRTFKEMIASLLCDAGLTADYWSYAARHAMVLWLKTRYRDGISAWTRWTGRADGIESIRKFGSRCVAQIPRQLRVGADPTDYKGQQGTILGQDLRTSGWIVLLDGSERSVNSRDVTIINEPRGITATDVGNSFEKLRAIEQDERKATAGERRARPTNDPEEVPNQTPSRKSTQRLKPSWAIEMQPEKRAIEVPEVDVNSPRLTRSQRATMVASEMALLTDGGSTIHEPRTYHDAITCPDQAKWKTAMKAELDNIGAKKTWKVTDLPAGRRAIGCKWVYKVKQDADGKITKYKARLVAQGFSQVPGVDFEETFAPVGRMTSLRII
jgi:hypothetical protein